MLTPLEIENRKFKKGLVGYNAAEVEEFAKVVSESYEALYKENLAYKDKVNTLTNAVKQYKSMEDTLQSAILVAQNAADEVKKNAHAKADIIIRDAENKASQILGDAGKEVTKVSYEYEEMKRKVEVFRTKIISLLTSQLDIVKEFSKPSEESELSEKNETEYKNEEIKKTETPDETPEDVPSILKKLERVTMELPKLILNEKGEYVDAELKDSE